MSESNLSQAEPSADLPREIVDALSNNWITKIDDPEKWSERVGWLWPAWQQVIGPHIEQRVAAARAAERERCAKLESALRAIIVHEESYDRGDAFVATEAREALGGA